MLLHYLKHELLVQLNPCNNIVVSCRICFSESAMLLFEHGFLCACGGFCEANLSFYSQIVQPLGAICDFGSCSSIVRGTCLVFCST